jgi:hypothetical protein
MTVWWEIHIFDLLHNGDNHLKISTRQCMWSTAKWSCPYHFKAYLKTTLKNETQGSRRGIVEDASVMGCNTL